MEDIPTIKTVFSAAALLLTFFLFYIYIRSILRDEVRPHVFSWMIWAAGTVIVFFAQLSDGAGIGAWPIGISGVITFLVAVLALTRSADKSIVLMDWVFLILALSALPLWFATSNPFLAVLVLTIVDLLGFGPSVRKSWVLPYEENAQFFALGAVRNGFVVVALENYSWTTVLFPAAVGLACFLFFAVILIRRQVVPQPVTSSQNG
ncbi:MAG: hypothetical protein ACFB0Z_15280 [Candidatus Phaeomarinobacter sp.]